MKHPMRINSVRLLILTLLISALMFLTAPPYAGQQPQAMATIKTRISYWEPETPSRCPGGLTLLSASRLTIMFSSPYKPNNKGKNDKAYSCTKHSL